MIKRFIIGLVVLSMSIALSGCDLFSREDATNYIVSFSTGEGSDVSSIEVIRGEAIDLPVSVLEGYTLAGWILSDSSDEPLLSSPYTPTEDVTLYARWAINSYSITFETYGGSTMYPYLAHYGFDVSDVEDPVKQGYTFGGWYRDSEFTIPYTLTTIPAESIILYAKWNINEYSISFEVNGGSSMDPITQQYQTDVVPPVQPFKEGYAFLGWYRDEGLSVSYTFTTMPSEDITLYAKWEELDWSDVEQYLSNLIPDELSEDVNLPQSYLDYTITWDSDHPDIVSVEGTYKRPYQATMITLSATIQQGQHSHITSYDINIEGYKSLSAPLTSSYIYRDYNAVTDAFFTTLDIINCAFIHADEYGNLTGTAVLNNINAYIMPKAREHGNWVLFSVAPDSDWSAIASSPSRINAFADNIVAMINQYGFDGVDIDWETPDPGEETYFTNMMQVIYTKVKENNPNHLVTAAIAGGKWQPPRYDLPNSHQYLDYINMMTYGMTTSNGYYQNALSESTSYANPTNLAGKTLISCSIEESVEIYNSYGIPNNKIIVGVAFYGIKQTRTYDALSQTWSSWTNAGSVSFTYITNVYLTNNDYQYFYDNNAGVPYILSTDGTLFISYDNPRSIADKSEYIIANNLAGMMYWENGHDSTGALLAAMDSGLNN